METVLYTIYTDEYDSVIYRNANNALHRTDGPAVEFANGSKYWYLNGERHRTDGPAVVLINGTKKWYLNGKLHRTDGPAIEHPNGTKRWFINEIELTEKEFIKRTSVQEFSMDELAEKLGIPVELLKIKK